MTTVNIFLQTKRKLNALFSIKYGSKKGPMPQITRIGSGYFEAWSHYTNIN